MPKNTEEATTLREWVRAQYGNSELRDIAQYGMAGGFSGATYYHQTCEIYDRFDDDIWTLASETADQMGEKITLAFLASLNGADAVDGDATFKNLLVWFAIETLATTLLDEHTVSEDEDE